MKTVTVTLPWTSMSNLIQIQQWLGERKCYITTDFALMSDLNNNKIRFMFYDGNNPLASLLALTWTK